jgi:hypothetical protein
MRSFRLALKEDGDRNEVQLRNIYKAWPSLLNGYNIRQLCSGCKFWA